MHYIVIFALLTASALADYQQQHYSFSPAVGSGSGTSFSATGEGRITAVRVWERYNNYIYGFQLRYGPIWSAHFGIKSGTPVEFELWEDEAIMQISGKYNHFINSLIFFTNKGRSLHVGQPSGYSFNMYPDFKEAELRFISGRFHGALTSFAAHWGTVGTYSSDTH